MFNFNSNIITKNICFAILGPIFTFIVIYNKIYNIFIKKEINCFSRSISYISVIDLYISLNSILLSLFTFVSFLMFFIWPLHKSIFKIIDKNF